MTFENATPRPWVKGKYGQFKGSNGKDVRTYDLGIGMAMASPTEEDRENSELIIKAVNAHEPLIEALSMCLELIDDMSRFANCMSLEDYGAFNKAPLIAKAALKLAGREA